MDPIAATTSPNLICGYSRAPYRYDEMCAADGLRAHWRGVAEGLDRLGAEELLRRRTELRRLLRENGATYNLHGDPEGLARTWELDPLPLAIGPNDWDRLEQGLVQRAAVMRAVAADLYGERRLLREGIVPPEIVFDAPDFQRPCADVWPPAGRTLLFGAADFVRGPQQRFFILKMSTGFPDGAGYALENRTAMAAVFPDLIRDCRVRRLAGFFRYLRERLAALAPRKTSAPRIAILSTGPECSTYFEQAYLAAYLGYPLVLGDDLLMRDGALWLKSLQGLEPVDVLLRCVPDNLSDPLELEHDSRQGVTGLLEALRRGSLAVINPPGSRLLETPGLQPFLPAIARFFLGQELLLPSPPARWCGHAQARKYVLAHLGELILHDLRRPDSKGMAGALLSAADKQRWRQRIDRRPQQVVAVEPIQPSTAPVSTEDRLLPYPQRLRTYLLDDGDRCRVLPGGLALSGGVGTDCVDADRRGTVSKDLWILADTPQQHISLWLQPDRVTDPLESNSVLPSRSAEHLFWVGRYAERSEGLLRLVRTVVRRIGRADRLQNTAEAFCLEQLLAALTRMANAPPSSPVAEGGRCRLLPEKELQAILGNPDRPGSLADGLQRMIQSASGVRHLWSIDSWRTINRIEALWKRVESVFGRISPVVEIELDRLIRVLMAFAGLNSENMTREQGWLLLDIGRRIERAAVLSRLLRETLIEPQPADVEHLLLEALLSTTENIITYRQRYRSYLNRRTVVEQLLVDDANPRSVIYQINRLGKHVTVLPQPRDGADGQAAALVQNLDDLLRGGDYARLTEGGPSPEGYRFLADLLQKVEGGLNGFSDRLTQVYFSHTPVSRQMPTEPARSS